MTTLLINRSARKPNFASSNIKHLSSCTLKRLLSTLATIVAGEIGLKFVLSDMSLVLFLRMETTIVFIIYVGKFECPIKRFKSIDNSLGKCGRANCKCFTLKWSWPGDHPFFNSFSILETSFALNRTWWPLPDLWSSTCRPPFPQIEDFTLKCSLRIRCTINTNRESRPCFIFLIEFQVVTKIVFAVVHSKQVHFECCSSQLSLDLNIFRLEHITSLLYAYRSVGVPQRTQFWKQSLASQWASLTGLFHPIFFLFMGQLVTTLRV